MLPIHDDMFPPSSRLRSSPSEAAHTRALLSCIRGHQLFGGLESLQSLHIDVLQLCRCSIREQQCHCKDQYDVQYSNIARCKRCWQVHGTAHATGPTVICTSTSRCNQDLRLCPQSVATSEITTDTLFSQSPCLLIAKRHALRGQCGRRGVGRRVEMTHPLGRFHDFEYLVVATSHSSAIHAPPPWCSSGWPNDLLSCHPPETGLLQVGQQS